MKENLIENSRKYRSKNRILCNKRSSAWAKKHPEKRKEYTKEYDRKNPEKKKARNLLNSAIRWKGFPKGDKCDLCGIKGKVDGHHDDYSKPLKVLWVCRDCHASVRLRNQS